MSYDTHKKYRILIIDDDEANRKVMEMLLVRENFEPILAPNGRIGLELAHSQKPAIIVLDVFMPRENGFDLLKQFKADHELNHIPVLLFTILDREESRQKAMELGACAYITKPFDMKEVVSHIKKNLIGRTE
ncbi:MAG: response regulator [Desulfobacterales bacterium]|nr:response regulator [Desulfobacterales bacterium]